MSAPREVTAREIAEATGVWETTVRRRARRESWPYREISRPGRPTRLYRVDALPDDIRRALGDEDPSLAASGCPGRQATCRPDGQAGTASYSPSPPNAVDTMSETVPPEDPLSRRWQRLPEAARQLAAARLELLDRAVAAAAAGNVSMRTACERVAEEHGSSPSAATLLRWWRRVRPLPAGRRAMALADRRPGGTATARMDPASWEAFKADFLRPAQPALAACGRRLRRLAEANGWTVPASDAALARRVRREIPPEVVTLSRSGPEALDRMIPPQIRDRESLASMQVVNADGHTWDVLVLWPDGHVGRPVMVCWQDVRSGRILAWRIGRSETAEAYRLSAADMLWRHGAPVQPDGSPGHAIVDNGRGIASQGLTGGSGAFRGGDRPGGPVGLLTELLGPDNIHWTLPYHGQSKPIERAFGDFCKSIATDPRFAGAYTGKDTASKPSDYGSRAVPIATFRQVVADGIAQHNARRGRTGLGMDGRSFDEVFEACRLPKCEVDAWQLARWLLEPVPATARKTDGAVRVHGAVYAAPELRELAGRSKAERSVIVRCDPQRLDRPAIVERPDGSLIARAEAQGRVPFLSAEGSRQRGKDLARLRRNTREQLAIHRSMSAADLGRLLDEAAAADGGVPPEPAGLPEIAASRPAFDPDELDRLNAAGDRNVLAALAQGGA